MSTYFQECSKQSLCYIYEIYSTNDKTTMYINKMILFYIAHLHAEQLQSVHEHAEPQLVFSSMKMEKKRF
jgi:hypothetical protein